MKDYDSHIYYGDPNNYCNLNTKNINNLTNVKVNLIGFININNNIEQSNDIKQNNILSIGSLDDLDFVNSNINGNNHSISGFNKLVLQSYQQLTLANIKFNNINSVDFNSSNISLQDVTFSNTNNQITVNLKQENTQLHNVLFNLNNSSMLLNIGSLENKVVIKDDSLSFAGTNGIVTINVGSELLAVKDITISGIVNELPTTINLNQLNNITLQNGVMLKSGNSTINATQVNFYGDISMMQNNNQLNLVNSKINGNILINGNSNNIILNNSSFNVANTFKVSGDYNTLVISNNFNQHININGNRNIANINENIITGTGILEFNGKNSQVNLNNSGTSYKSANVSNIKFIFNSSGNNDIFLGEEANTSFASQLEIFNNSKVNINIMGFYKVNLDYITKGTISNFNIANNSNISIGSKSITVNNYNQEKDATFNISLNNNNEDIISAQNMKFNHGNINLMFNHVSSFIKKIGDHKTYTLFSSNSNIVDLNQIMVKNGIFHYKIEVSNNTIKLTPVKVKTIAQIVNEGYIKQTAKYSKSNFNALAELLDDLWENSNNKQVVEELDHIVNISNNQTDVVKFLNELFPISNNTLYLINNNTNNAFIKTFADIENVSSIIANEENIGHISFSSQYYKNNQKLVTGVNNNITNNINGYGYLGSAAYSFNKQLKVALAAAVNSSNMQDSYTNINGNGYNIAGYVKYNIFSNFIVNSNVVFSNNNYKTIRKIIMDSNTLLVMGKPSINSYYSDLQFLYNWNLASTKKFSLTVTPYIKNSFSYNQMNNYCENSNSGLKVNGFNINNYVSQLGINTAAKIRYNNAVIIPNAGVNVSNNVVQAITTNFNFKSYPNSNNLQINNNGNGLNSINIKGGVSYVTLNNHLMLNISTNFELTKYNINKLYEFGLQYNL